MAAADAAMRDAKAAAASSDGFSGGSPSRTSEGDSAAAAGGRRGSEASHGSKPAAKKPSSEPDRTAAKAAAAHAPKAVDAKSSKLTSTELLLLLSPSIASSANLLTAAGPYSCKICQSKFPSLHALGYHQAHHRKVGAGAKSSKGSALDNLPSAPAGRGKKRMAQLQEGSKVPEAVGDSQAKGTASTRGRKRKDPTALKAIAPKAEKKQRGAADVAAGAQVASVPAFTSVEPLPQTASGSPNGGSPTTAGAHVVRPTASRPAPGGQQALHLSSIIQHQEHVMRQHAASLAQYLAPPASPGRQAKPTPLRIAGLAEAGQEGKQNNTSPQSRSEVTADGVPACSTYPSPTTPSTLPLSPFSKYTGKGFSPLPALAASNPSLAPTFPPPPPAPAPVAPVTPPLDARHQGAVPEQALIQQLQQLLQQQQHQQQQQQQHQQQQQQQQQQHQARFQQQQQQPVQGAFAAQQSALQPQPQLQHQRPQQQQQQQQEILVAKLKELQQLSVTPASAPAAPCCALGCSTKGVPCIASPATLSCVLTLLSTLTSQAQKAAPATPAQPAPPVAPAPAPVAPVAPVTAQHVYSAPAVKPEPWSVKAEPWAVKTEPWTVKTEPWMPPMFRAPQQQFPKPQAPKELDLELHL